MTNDDDPIVSRRNFIKAAALTAVAATATGAGAALYNEALSAPATLSPMTNTALPTVSTAVIPPSSTAAADAFTRLAAAQAENVRLQAALDAYSGKPGFSELRQLAWRPGGGLAAFTPGVPMNRALVEESSHMSRRILNERGLDYVKMYVCGPRFARGLHHLVWNRTLATEDAAADDAYRALVMGYAGMGMQCGRAPLKYQALHWSILEPAVRDTCNALKSALDPNHVIAPGRYGIG